ncbi:hypothetical protein AAFF_G00040670 [Aldrovandia affinis]|uniref:Uncharacterized protein n=1 Tax=Aldrovandia affinis TaxID=143900 RepID=A0AAD7S2R8_9TELE|nr:hypothetical protein AAFF_G00040670 [Aldrovandia affinis]
MVLGQVMAPPPWPCGTTPAPAFPDRCRGSGVRAGESPLSAGSDSASRAEIASGDPEESTRPGPLGEGG